MNTSQLLATIEFENNKNCSAQTIIDSTIIEPSVTEWAMNKFYGDLK